MKKVDVYKGYSEMELAISDLKERVYVLEHLLAALKTTVGQQVVNLAAHKNHIDAHKI
jgi:hypothetical protein